MPQVNRIFQREAREAGVLDKLLRLIHGFYILFREAQKGGILDDPTCDNMRSHQHAPFLDIGH